MAESLGGKKLKYVLNYSLADEDGCFSNHNKKEADIDVLRFFNDKYHLNLTESKFNEMAIHVQEDILYELRGNLPYVRDWHELNTKQSKEIIKIKDRLLKCAWWATLTDSARFKVIDEDDKSQKKGDRRLYEWAGVFGGTRHLTHAEQLNRLKMRVFGRWLALSQAEKYCIINNAFANREPNIAVCKDWHGSKEKCMNKLHVGKDNWKTHCYLCRNSTNLDGISTIKCKFRSKILFEDKDYPPMHIIIKSKKLEKENDRIHGKCNVCGCKG